ncbi:MAG TPA: hypothetical protein VFX09_06245 [Burkholderiales bacterium]|nr:hypothetical protein [Burkholderiales bacterium]
MQTEETPCSDQRASVFVILIDGDLQNRDESVSESRRRNGTQG